MNARAAEASMVIVTTDDLRELIREVVGDALADHFAPAATATGRVGTKEIAEALGVSRAKIHELAEDGAIPFVWVGDVRRFDVAECIAALQALPAPAKKRGGPGRPKK
jgi:excisionase family DNA binding protein